MHFGQDDLDVVALVDGYGEGLRLCLLVRDLAVLRLVDRAGVLEVHDLYAKVSVAMPSAPKSNRSKLPEEKYREKYIYNEEMRSRKNVPSTQN